MKILQKNNKKLRRVADPITEINSDMRKLAVGLKKALLASRNGVGIAAPQVGENVRMIIVAIGSLSNLTVMINPEILKFSSDQSIAEEGCLSVVGEFGLVERANSITVEFKTLAGEVVTNEYKDFTARCIQHEVDHLGGILFIDKLVK